MFGVKKLLNITEENDIEMEARFDSLTKKLMIISSIPDKGRIAVESSGKISLEPDSKLTWLKRAVTGDDRSRTVKTLKVVISTVDEFVNDTLNSRFLTNEGPTEDNSHFKQECSRKLEELSCIREQLISSKEGISRLRKTTYKEDVPVCSDLQIIENKVDSIVKLIEIRIEKK